MSCLWLASTTSFFNFSFLPRYGKFFLQGVEYTLILAVVSVLLAVIPALLLALMRLSKSRLIKGVSGAYIAVFRSTPLLVQLSIIYYGLFGLIDIPRITILSPRFIIISLISHRASVQLLLAMMFSKAVRMGRRL